ncbi:MAG: glycosyl transferase [gamma proteobacterium symbiont of Ctena orbiculata]|uniref:Glycosyltransferase family 2 protein n=1 Tax=Candidatus Thiodiazotropha taylori TaxID=2792791 RepID=A0A944M8Z3_9GAMM|nr:glycosyltransferase family 2 protein [Candidatus Thiodiazotropha taylori]PVV09620.1 MAG: glycosyl transferase [gamma proteobacterium symbiont of Ctena orbiculata]MBT2989504.1 glycosyltransferase family 2 protein [Candidatus Thiodiazotropha taylori]MBT2997084.1 glycosyltransferase family 2 protein [Candidatus Thiodiazotropha taylori]MBT3001238.1 glycosyltransferase family 2 protein [Candidatus Thiodiazotropha taylori]
MKLIIQIPCFNEEKTLALALAELPREVAGFDQVEWLVIDDGSTDATRQVALENGVDHVVGFTRNQGLAKIFMLGLDACVRRGADVIVNTDADNQYDASYIPKLTQPILEEKADMVIGARPIKMIEHFSFTKKVLQHLGSSVVRKVSQTDIPDAPSGFRAFSRDAAMKLNVFNEYTYTLETIIQAGMKHMAVTSIPVDVNEDLRPSRLVKSISSYIKKSIVTMLRIFVVYKPFRFFLIIGLILFGLGMILGLRFLYFYLFGDGQGHIQSVILAGVMMGIGFQTILVAFVADLLSVNRKLLEEIQYRLRKLETQPDQGS